jgi:hypothetical protein
MRRGREEIIGYGDYRRIRAGDEMQEALSWGVYRPMTHAHGLSGLLDPLLDTEDSTGLVAVKQEAVAPSIQVLESMSFTEDKMSPLAIEVVGTASFVLGPDAFQGSWVRSYADRGYIVMVEEASVSTGIVRVAMTKHPGVIAVLCVRAGGWVILTGPIALVIAAQALLGQHPAPGTPTPAEACVVQGGMWDGEASRCVMPPGPEASPPPAGKSSWILPVAVIGGVVLVAGVLIIAQKG